MELDKLTSSFAETMGAVDGRRPIASNVRGIKYSPGIGPNEERATIQLVSEEMENQGGLQVKGFQLEILYPDNPQNRCDLCIWVSPDWEWTVEIKMLRLMGDNGKPNDNQLSVTCRVSQENSGNLLTLVLVLPPPVRDSSLKIGKQIACQIRPTRSTLRCNHSKHIELDGRGL